MGSMPFAFSWDLKCAPLNDAELEYYRTLMADEDFEGDYYCIKFHIKRQLCIVTQSHPQQPPSIAPPMDYFSFHGSVLLSAQESIENFISYIQMHFPIGIIPHQLMDQMMPIVMARANYLAHNSSDNSHTLRDIHNDFCLFNFDLDIAIQNFRLEQHGGDGGDDDMIDSAIRESMEDIHMVPASKSAIESLERVKLEKKVTVEECSICLMEFGDDEVSSMPCKHVYHHQCITQWLKTSHQCPLCRYPMPTLDK